MKKLLAILLALSMLLSFAACGKGDSDDKNGKKKKDKDNKTEHVGDNNGDEVEGSVVDTLSDAEIEIKFEALIAFMEENEDVLSEMQSALSEIDGFEEAFENGFTDEVAAEVKSVCVEIFSNYASDEDAQIFAEIYCVILDFQVLMSQNPEFMEDIFEEAMQKGYEDDSEEFWEYVKDELSAYVPEWCIEPFVRPIYLAVTNNSRIKTCVANQREIRSQITNFIMCEAYDRVMDQEIEFYYYYGEPAYSLMGEGFVATEIESMFANMPCCPADGIVVVEVYNDGNGNYSVETYCRDNCDGTDHNV